MELSSILILLASCQQTSSVLILLASCQQTCMTYTIAVCTVKTPDDGHRNCPKNVEFYSINKFEKLVHLVGFIISKPNKVACLLYLYRPWVMSCVVRYVHHSHNYLFHFLP